MAIHSQSRLIAVGSNRQQITVFAPACSDPPKQEYHGDHSESSPPPSSFDEQSENAPQAHLAGLSYFEWEIHRWPNWETLDYLPQVRDSSHPNIVIRVTLPPRVGHNIPSVDFTSDGTGDALAVVAADVNGNLVSATFSIIWDGHVYSKRRILIETISGSMVCTITTRG